jgi:hypothetical protein
MRSICFPPSAFCFLPSADCLLLTAGCLLNLRGVRVGGTRGPYRSLRQDVALARKKETLVTLKNDRTMLECC